MSDFLTEPPTDPADSFVFIIRIAYDPGLLEYSQTHPCSTPECERAPIFHLDDGNDESTAHFHFCAECLPQFVGGVAIPHIIAAAYDFRPANPGGYLN